MDELTRFESEGRIQRDMAHIETQVLLRSRGSAGPLFVLRWDMAESHMSDPFASRCDHHDLKHELVHMARHVRRNQLLFTKERIHKTLWHKQIMTTSLHEIVCDMSQGSLP